jgi:anti-sigma B factor antagonist
MCADAVSLTLCTWNLETEGLGDKETTVAAQADLTLDFAVDVASAEGGTVVKTCGELDVATAPLLREALMKAQSALLRRGPDHSLVVDLSGVTFADASALGVLAGAARRARRVGGEVVLRDPTRMTVRLLEITGLLRTFRVERQDGDGAAVRVRAYPPLPDRDVA